MQLAAGGTLSGVRGDGSRDPRIEDVSNLYLIHPLARALLPTALRLGISANAVSLIGLALGAVAAASYAEWGSSAMALLGLVFSIGWMVADGLDGMVARATGTASATGRFLDGLCDHGVFILIYVTLAASIGSAQAWALAIVAGVCHAVQSSLYEGERARFHRRAKGLAQPALPVLTGNPLVRAYDRVATGVDRFALPFERRMASDADPVGFGRDYARRAAPVLRWMTPLSANCRVAAIFVACLAGDPALFWLFEIVILSPLAVITLAAHRRVERRFAALATIRPSPAPFAAAANKEPEYR
ncbi:CDP-alcohol phosphatidyltransferase family protein [Sphingomonas sp. Y38-1Y]|uniref:CDP-alcohol phosphatidyltransferase family protein n=1 Tax=Sphingomonas sp. Y38-1Y TaxID=3078265 RepID=UPI0028E30F61|nr:CDP-alcohol phosphatidyltransferase family protein [Sphingomonas sp. Y38-1Y]